MAREGRPPRFRIPLPKPVPIARADAREFRTSPRKRGLDSKWDRLSVAFRRRNPFCRWCGQEGRDDLADRVDHILPRREYPELTYTWGNLQSLCVHHDNIKQAMEIYARDNGLLDRLPFWCEAIENRPVRFRAGIIMA